MICAVLIVASCDRSAESPPAVETPGLPVETPLNQASVQWSSQVSGGGMSLTLSGAEGAPLLHIACVRNPAAMTIVGETFMPIGSEERLSFSVDDEPFVFVANLAANRPSGVEAQAPISADLLMRFEMAREVSAVYGAQQIGPFPPPDSDSIERFVAACRMITVL